METEDTIRLPVSSNSGESSENNEHYKSQFCPGEAGSQPGNHEAEEDTRDEGNLGLREVDIGPEKGIRGPGFSGDDIETEEHTAGLENSRVNIVDSVTKVPSGDLDNINNLGLNQLDFKSEDGQFPVETEVDMDLVDSPVLQVNIQVADTVTVSENRSSFGFRVNAQNYLPDTLNEICVHNHMSNGGSVSGVKRARITYDEPQPSVHVRYNSLKRASKRKLEELLQQWSEWHAHHGSSSQDLKEVLESGEETYFPALCVGMGKSSAVSFWIENQTRSQQSSGYIPSDCDTVPLYDRGFALGLSSTDGPINAEGGLEIVNEAARCFNCGSYNHSLKECSKPRNNIAVSNARKQHKAKWNQNAAFHSATRYYQNSSGGKYDGLKPGSLDAETRRLLGLGELDPPPWLNRMRELGYPPGYLDPDDEDQLSGITIFADENVKEEQEEGEIIEMGDHEPPRKMVVDYPGVNAPIPENADERLWAAGSSSSDLFRNRLQRRLNHSSEPISRWHRNEHRGLKDSFDEGPPGVDSVLGPISSYPPRYDIHEFNYSFDSPRDLTPSRSHSDRGRRSSLVYADFVNEYDTDERTRDYPYRSSDEYDRHRHRSRR